MGKRLRYSEEAVCGVEGCNAKPKGLGLCVKHYTRMRRHGDTSFVTPPKWQGIACSIDGCDKPADSRGWCLEHYHRWHRKGDPVATDGRSLKKPTYEVCTIDGCSKRHIARGLCSLHYGRWKRYGDASRIPDQRLHSGKACAAKGCQLPQVSKGFCDRHYRRVLKYGDPNVVKKDIYNIVPARAKAAKWSRTRLARKAGAKLVDYTTEQVIERMAYWGNKCWMCGGPFEHVDHVKPLAKGGTDCLANFRPSCASCNGRKNAHWYGVRELHRFVKA